MLADACFDRALERLTRATSCMQHLSLPMPGGQLPLVPKALPVYLLHDESMAARGHRMIKLLSAAGAPDLTLITCASRQVVDGLNFADRTCLFPEYALTHWSKPVPGMANGTLSLALKHQLAYRDIGQRRLSAALLLEDDSTVPPTLWVQLAAYTIPADAHVFYVGSYSSNPRGGSLKDEDVVPGLKPTVRVRSTMGRNGTRPAILASSAYVVTLDGAMRLLQPVRAETDIQLSLLTPSPLCKRTPPSCYPALGTAGCGPTVGRCALSPPPRQYGPTRWIIWQDPSAHGRGSHNLPRNDKGANVT
mmetsp:Transcript_4507/g.11911  ORF Transcript_4507/g.11911 Transcript_4507/m.11911 type:complete len:305 (+) Transcript_4507:258-1172(+)